MDYQFANVWVVDAILTGIPVDVMVLKMGIR